MIPKELLDFILALLIPVAGAMGYVHGVFATNTRVDQIEKTVSSSASNTRVDQIEQVVRRVDKVLCKMAIKGKLEDADTICTTK